MAEGPLLDGENLLVYPRTMFGTAYVYDVETEDGDLVRLLEVEGVFESASYIGERRFEPTFEYYRAFDHLFEALPEPKRVLMIGGGGYAYPKHFVASQPHGSIDVVEIDPTITRIARKHFYLDELIEEFQTKESGRLNLICADGRAYVQNYARRGSKPYDAIINDSFSAGEATASLLDDEGLGVVKSCLSSQGLYLINVICDLEEDARDFLELVGILRTRFEHVHVIPCPDEVFGGVDNNLVIATDGCYEFSGQLPLPDESLFA